MLITTPAMIERSTRASINLWQALGFADALFAASSVTAHALILACRFRLDRSLVIVCSFRLVIVMFDRIVALAVFLWFVCMC